MSHNFNKEQIEKVRNILSKHTDSKLVTHINACVHCGLCGSSCVFYKTFNDPKYIPGKKIDLVASLYKRYNTLLGRIAPSVVHARELTDEMITEMVDLLFGGCTMCGRCVPHCSIGVDIPFIVRTGRRLLAEMNRIPLSLKATADTALAAQNNMGIVEEEFLDTIQWMEEELQDELGDTKAQIPINQENNNVLYTLNPREVKFFPLSISAAAKIFYAAKEQWTISSKMYDVTNYGYFTGDNTTASTIAKNMFDEVLRLKSSTLVLGECGHGSRALRWEAPNFLKQHPDFNIITLIEIIEQYLKEGRIKVDKYLNTQKYTLHDPCNITRNGGLFNSLRYVMQNIVPELIEMTPYGAENFCCGGGGGMLAMSEYNDRRLKVGEIKAEQIRKTDANVVITPCHNCIDQLSQLNHTYKLNVEIKSVAEIVADALVIV
ncbi:MAG: (Fe-S)-binding protein [Bacteroidales bacterium]|jgi:Fe-S oxidoreductase|nr:(Fe-S)-binding protein [Bacteroidales bacterium]